MPKRRRVRFVTRVKGIFRRRHKGAGRWSVDTTDLVLGTVASVAGEALKSALAKYNVPDQLRNAPADGLGLYILGVAFNRQGVRSVGLGRVLGVTVFKLGEAIGG